MVILPPPATVRGVQFKRPQKVGGLFEVGSDRVDLVNEVLHTDDAVFTWK